MEHQPTQQTVVQPTNEPVEEVPHVLHPEHQSVASSEKVVDNFQRFDIATAQSMIQPGSKPQEQGLGEPVVEQVEEPGAGQALESGQEAEPRERESKVLRPENWITEKIKQRIRALATAGMVGLSGAGVTDANAIELRGVKETAAVLGVGILNKTVLSQTPVAVVLDQKGNPVVIPKTPGQQAMTTPASFEAGVLEHAAKMGLNVSDNGLLFTISRNSDPSNNLSITKFYNPTWYTTSIRLEKAPNGGLRLLAPYTKDGLPRPQMAIINIDTTGKMVTTVIGN